MAEKVQGGRLVARAIAAEGVDAIFTLSGGHVMPIYEGCRHEGVRVFDVRHEQSAAHAAEAYGRVRRAAGVAVVTAGPGVTGTVTGVANAYAAQVPLVVIGGARPLVQAERGALQEFDQLALMKPITKWAAVCAHASRIPEYVAIAFRQALAPPRGPVYLELPMDILFEDAEPDDAPGRARVGRAGRPRSQRRRGSRCAPPRCRAAGDRRWSGDLVGRRRRGARRPGDEAPGTGVRQRVGTRLASARPSSALPACPLERARDARMSCSSRARRSTFAFGTALSARAASSTPTAIRGSSAETAFPTSLSPETSRLVLEALAAAVPDAGSRERLARNGAEHRGRLVGRP